MFSTSTAAANPINFSSSSGSRKPTSPNFIAKILLSSHKRSTSSSSSSASSTSSSPSNDSSSITTPLLESSSPIKTKLSKKDQAQRDVKRSRRSGGVFGVEDLERSEEMYWEGAAKEMGF